tara:strand:- start:346 stop:462 length:117 start_codon:yes stop_codon:yes gene_type:complete
LEFTSEFNTLEKKAGTPLEAAKIVNIKQTVKQPNKAPL